ncbi:MAG: NAD(P)-binding domain-containing protein [Gemmatimonadetes bacterium]|nr:NAD(P)-binding domain-containing protein [Gemmatimonadota bacterium]
MRIAVIGSGNVGGTLGRRWATLGHDVVFGVRDPKRGAAAVKGGAGEGALPIVPASPPPHRPCAATTGGAPTSSSSPPLGRPSPPRSPSSALARSTASSSSTPPTR